MNTEAHANLFFAVVSAVPVLVVTAYLKRGRPNYHGLWVCGSLLVAWAAYLFVMLSDSQAQIQALSPIASFSRARLDEFLKTIALWMYVVPVTVMSIGANLISEYLTREPPAWRSS